MQEKHQNRVTVLSTIITTTAESYAWYPFLLVQCEDAEPPSQKCKAKKKKNMTDHVLVPTETNTLKAKSTPNFLHTPENARIPPEKNHD